VGFGDRLYELFNWEFFFVKTTLLFWGVVIFSPLIHFCRFLMWENPQHWHWPTYSTNFFFLIINFFSHDILTRYHTQEPKWKEKEARSFNKLKCPLARASECFVFQDAPSFPAQQIWIVDNVLPPHTLKEDSAVCAFHDNMSCDRRTPREDAMWWNFKVLTTALRRLLNF